MKNYAFYLMSFILLFVFTSCKGNNDKNAQSLAAQTTNDKEPTLKRYSLKSGIVHYKTKINGKVMGSVIDGSGTEDLYFKNWGAIELKKTDEKKTTHINIFGQKKTEVDETHTINKLDNGKSYTVDMKNKIIYVQRDPAMEMMKTFGNGDVEKTGEKMLESMGGKKVGKEKILGYTCDVWEIPGGKQWIYKGIPLKLQMTVMGITTTNEATSAAFNKSVPDKYFKLPDYPIEEMPGYQSDEVYNNDKKDMKKGAEKLRKMSFEEYKTMLKKDDPEAFKEMSDADLKMSYKLMQKMAQQMSH